MDPVSYCIGKYFEAEVVGLVQQQAGKGWGSLPGCALRATNAGGWSQPRGRFSFYGALKSILLKNVPQSCAECNLKCSGKNDHKILNVTLRSFRFG